ncbi:Heterokaryon incompatibility protein 6 OR allele [Lachnellula suecica]|uniref:Heterokaryon incompatibility protein 6 OR allele n=1 Tax=Lachnellula suecica TaxID=602035 RepID=A0A8T9CBS7_9HELO|nr:Heterokaryon incompatibility protein 6 OR allele [Lachnellula suecica]
MDPADAVTASDGEAPGTGVYKHQPIHSKTEIRILEIHPPDPNDPEALHGELVTARLADKPSFEAISYAWGEPIFSSTLEFPTGQYAITATLAAALRRFRLPDRKRRLWADAVCIDQCNNEEKGHQVKLMADVYRGAAHVLVWLGEGSEKTDEAIDFLSERARDSWRYGVNASCPWEVVIRDTQRGSPVWNALAALLPKLEAILDSLLKFYGQAWFARLWVIQEVALASHLTFYNGWKLITHSEFSAATVVLYKFLDISGSEGLNAIDGIIQGVMLSEVIRWHEQKQGEQTKDLDLLSFVDANFQGGHSNDLDLVFALLGLSRPVEDVEIEVDYEMSVEDLFMDFTLRYLEIGMTHILDFAGNREPGLDRHSERAIDKRKPPFLPSWAVDWRSPLSNLLNFAFEGFKSATDCGPSLVLDRKLLPLIGVLGTNIGNVSRAVEFPEPKLANSREEHILYIHECLNDFRRTMSAYLQSRGTGMYRTGEDATSVFARSLVLDGRLSKTQVYLRGVEPEDLLDSCQERAKQNEFGKAEISRRTELYVQYLRSVLNKRKLFLTAAGDFGIGPRSMKQGDSVAAIHGSQTPFILRRVGELLPTTRSDDKECSDSGVIGFESDKRSGKNKNNPEEHSRTNTSNAPESQAKSEQQSKPPNSGDEPRQDYQNMTMDDIKERWQLIGRCYLHGFMDNEILQPEFDDPRQMFFLQ